VLLLGILVIQNTVRGRQNQLTERTGRQHLLSPLVDVTQAQIEARRDHTGFVDATDEVHDDFAGAAVIHNFELADVAMLEHDLEELDHDFGGRSDQDLALASLLRVGDRGQAVAQH